jgi:predicted dehydrogenase
MREKIRWGILGLGSIANQFTRDLLLVEDAELSAVASRDVTKADAFAKKYGALHSFGSYDELLESDKIDIVYIATPHDSHAEITIRAIEAGKHVLCEKPLALNARQVEQMMEASKRCNRFLMEAFWTRFNPSFCEVLRKVRQGDIGKVRYINAEFAFRVENPSPRMIDMKTGGGSLLDMGVYPIFLAYTILGVPEKVFACSSFYESGADQQTSMILQYEESQAVLHSSFASPSNMSATISGESGRFTLNSIWHETQSYELVQNNHRVTYNFPTEGKGFTYEILECHQCLRSGKLSSKTWSTEDSLELIRITDRVRKATGLTYPSENEKI